MRFSVKASNFAKEDRKNIVKYLAQYSVNAPHKFKRELERYIAIIGDNPNIFSRYHTQPEYRHVVVFGSYVMFYSVDEAEKTVLIYRILHGAQDIENIL